MDNIDNLVDGDSYEQITKMNSKINKGKTELNMQNLCNPNK